MQNRLRRPLAACLCVSLIFACALQAGAQRTGQGKRVGGPVAGPSIPLPAGQSVEAAEQPAAQGEEQEQRTAVRQRWEYCAITGVAMVQKDRWSNPVGMAYVRYFRGGGESVEGAHEEEALANAMTKLGEEGWELVAVRESFSLSDGYGQSSARYFFKRPR